jgi:SAM-dependent methyltransferase
MRVLNVGGNDRRIPIPPHYAGWEHLILDIDPDVKPDICADAREMTSLEAGTFDAVYCSHNLEHYFAHDVARVLAGFLHVLRPEGFAEIRVPDIEKLMHTAVVRNLDIEDVAYESAAGPVRVLDVLYGFGPEIERSGHDFFAHKTGFTRKSLTRALHAAGFATVVAGPSPVFLELRALAFRSLPSPAQNRLLGLAP